MNFFPEITFDLVGIVFLVFCGAVFVQLLYVLIFHLRLLVRKNNEKSDELPPVTVIICARNEEDNLFKNLPKVLEQDYPKFEVIVVNDQSVDDSNHIIKAFQRNYSNLRMIELERNPHRKFGKKLPLTIGIKGATHDYITLIDADCYPNSKNWLKSMMSCYSEGKDIVIGYGPYEKEKGFLNKIIRFDTTNIALTYLSFAITGRPYMAVGRNMSYKKAKFFEVDGFKKHYHIQSGDDDLFMQDAATRKNTAINIDPESFVLSTPKNTWNDWIKQKQRHYTTASDYRLINKAFLGIFPMSMFLMLVSFFILLFNFEWWMFVVAIFALRTAVYWLVDGLIFKKLDMKDLIPWFPLFELLHFIMMPFIYYSKERTEPNQW